ncbi:uncharacterized protein LOC103848875 [Brassica rapa]|uniref:uncharacterized protein LOC103848875 n=1 Tax=Brassica campestris TaxID=3711 RepID=UPI0004F17265|nr:uncharacterized protein LOC103848875 [Brassica rapa]
MGIRKEATVEEAVFNPRGRRRHRVGLLNEIEEELRSMRDIHSEELDDVSQRRRESGYNRSFSTSETWRLVREGKAKCEWTRGVWFSRATPKYAFMAWLANLNRLSTMDRIAQWNPGVDETCVLCKSACVSRDHLFFECSYSGQIWESLANGIMGNLFSNSWSVIMNRIATGGNLGKMKLFCLRYAFQTALYTIWRERNKVKHDEKLIPVNVLKKLVDKNVRNKLSLLRSKCVKGMEGSLQVWFGTRM